MILSSIFLILVSWCHLSDATGGSLTVGIADRIETVKLTLGNDTLPNDSFVIAAENRCGVARYSVG